MVMKKKSCLTQEIVKELLDYDPLTGVFTWKWRDQHWFESYRSQCSWNAKFAGKVAFTVIAKRPDGEETYPTATILYEKGHTAHRIAFLWMLGYWPHEVDHKNRNKKDTRWANLREVTRGQNCRNRDKARNNTSGRVGVRKHGVHGKYEARISFNGAMIQLGVFVEFNDAVKAREAAERKYGYTRSNRGAISI